jgi:hypothetical protein
MAEAGMLKCEPLRETVQKLFNVRTQLHDILLGEHSVGEKYETCR